MGKVNKTNNYTEFYYKAFRNILFVSVPLTIISAIILSLPHSSAYSSSTDSVALTLPSACTISANVVTPHTITLVNGQKQDDIGNTKINAYCNDNNGYFIYAIGSSNDIAGNTDLISSVNDNYNIHTGIYSNTLTTSTPSSWAMKLSSNNGTYAPTIIDGYGSYSLIPETDTIVAYRTSGTSMDINTDLTGSYFNTTYQIYANSIQPAGTYLGKVKYTMTHPYDASQLTTIEKAYDIAGKDKVTITDPTTGETIGSYYSMQDMSDRICSLVTANETEEQLVDIRDNKIYYVSKLLDGHCWMTENLSLDLVSNTASENYIALTSENTDIDILSYDPNNGAYSVAGGYSKNESTGIVTWSPENATSKSSYNTWINSDTKPSSYNSGDQYYYSSGTDANDLSLSLEQCKNYGYSNCEHYAAGNYYNWTAAIASNDSSTFNSAAKYTNATNSICPKGWRLPIGTNAGNSIREFGNLLSAQNIIDSTTSQSYLANGFNEVRSTPLYFTRSGTILSNNPQENGSVGNYWSSTNIGDGYASYLTFDKDNIKTDQGYYGYYYHHRYYGRSVRCLAR